MTVRPRLRRHLLFAALFVSAASCASNGPPAADKAAEAEAPTDAASPEVTKTADGEEAVIVETRELVTLPVRDGPREEATFMVPHVQLWAEPVPEVDAELRRRAFSLPGVENRESETSLRGARSLWLADDLELARPEVLQAGREFAHIHPNGSLHVWLPVDRAFEAYEKRWAEFHPWVGQDDFWDGMVMIYTPETFAELDITMRLIVDAYNYVTGAELDPRDVS